MSAGGAFPLAALVAIALTTVSAHAQEAAVLIENARVWTHDPAWRRRPAC